MHTREYAAAALAELTEELERLGRLGAAAETLSATYEHTAQAVRALVNGEYQSWLESELATIRAAYQVDDVSVFQRGIEAVSEVLEDLAAVPSSEVGALQAPAS